MWQQQLPHYLHGQLFSHAPPLKQENLQGSAFCVPPQHTIPPPPPQRFVRDSDVLGAATKIRRLAQHCEDPLAQVQALALNNLRLQNETIPTELWQRFKNLAILELQSNDLSELIFQIPTLTELDISFNRFERLDCLNQFPGLRRLHMKGNPVEQKRHIYYHLATICPKLETIDDFQVSMLRSQVNKWRDRITSDVLSIWRQRQDALVKCCSDEKALAKALVEIFETEFITKYNNEDCALFLAKAAAYNIKDFRELKEKEANLVKRRKKQVKAYKKRTEMNFILRLPQCCGCMCRCGINNTENLSTLLKRNGICFETLEMFEQELANKKQDSNKSEGPIYKIDNGELFDSKQETEKLEDRRHRSLKRNSRGYNISQEGKKRRKRQIEEERENSGSPKLNRRTEQAEQQETLSSVENNPIRGARRKDRSWMKKGKEKDDNDDDGRSSIQPQSEGSSKTVEMLEGSTSSSLPSPFEEQTISGTFVGNTSKPPSHCRSRKPKHAVKHTSARQTNSQTLSRGNNSPELSDFSFDLNMPSVAGHATEQEENSLAPAPKKMAERQEPFLDAKQASITFHSKTVGKARAFHSKPASSEGLLSTHVREEERSFEILRWLQPQQDLLRVADELVECTNKGKKKRQKATTKDVALADHL